jgi:hypothetical protein
MPSCCRDKVNRSTGRRAAGVVFAKPSGQFHHEMTTSVHLSGLVPSRQIIMTQDFRPPIRPGKNHANGSDYTHEE